MTCFQRRKWCLTCSRALSVSCTVSLTSSRRSDFNGSSSTDAMLADMVATPSSVRFYAWSLKIIPMADDHVFFIPRRIRLSICERNITLSCRLLPHAFCWTLHCGPRPFQESGMSQFQILGRRPFRLALLTSTSPTRFPVWMNLRIECNEAFASLYLFGGWY